MENLPIVAISQGDPNGVGLEVIIKLFSNQNIYKYCTPILYANPKTFVSTKKHLGLNEPMFNLIKTPEEARPKKLNLIGTSDTPFEPNYGNPDASAGKEAFLSLNKAVEDCKTHKLPILVTAPLDKHTVAMNHDGFTGHTGFIGKMFEQKPLMFMVSDELKISLVTEHIGISEIASQLSIDKVYNTINQTYSSLRTDFGVITPRIAVLGLNPHAGDNGTIGKEEKEIIIPAIKKAFDEEILVYGPYSADGFFGGKQYHSFDAVVAMYHDQGLIPFKSVAYFDGVNYTAGLSLVRTSPDHGTAYDIAGKKIAEPLSFSNAVYEAIRIYKRKHQIAEDSENPLPFTELRREKFRIDF